MISEDPARDGSNWYSYVGNNPINFTDPNGLSASDALTLSGVNRLPPRADPTSGLVVVGNDAYKGAILGALQKLTLDTLSMDTSGAVSISSTFNYSNDRRTGTDLVRQLILPSGGQGDRNAVTIMQDNRVSIAAAVPTDPNGRFDPTQGTSTTVYLDPKQDFTSLLKTRVTPGSTTSVATALAHELIHALDNKNGAALTGTTGKDNTREINTVGLGSYANRPITENSIRKEQGDGQRIKY